jgi:hypothetical protein
MCEVVACFACFCCLYFVHHGPEVGENFVQEPVFRERNWFRDESDQGAYTYRTVTGTVR